jgi:putative Holliday junction resolvase
MAHNTQHTYMGIDYGTKRIGVALSDTTGTLAFPHETVPAGRESKERIAMIVREHSVEIIVMGESRMRSGKPNILLEESRTYARALEEATGLPVFFEWEYDTSREARKIQGNTGVNDASAAALILQRYLDKTQNTHERY